MHRRSRSRVSSEDDVSESEDDDSERLLKIAKTLVDVACGVGYSRAVQDFNLVQNCPHCAQPLQRPASVENDSRHSSGLHHSSGRHQPLQRAASATVSERMAQGDTQIGRNKLPSSRPTAVKSAPAAPKPKEPGVRRIDLEGDLMVTVSSAAVQKRETHSAFSTTTERHSKGQLVRHLLAQLCTSGVHDADDFHDGLGEGAKAQPVE